MTRIMSDLCTSWPTLGIPLIDGLPWHHFVLIAIRRIAIPDVPDPEFANSHQSSLLGLTFSSHADHTPLTLYLVSLIFLTSHTSLDLFIRPYTV